MKLISRIDSALKSLSAKIASCQETLDREIIGMGPDMDASLPEPPDYVRVGMVIKGDYAYPALFNTASVVGFSFEITDASRDAVNAAMESLAVQIYGSMDRRYVDLRTCDPERLGMNLRDIASLAVPDVSPDALQKVLESISSESVRFIRNGLSKYSDISEYNALSGSAQPYRIVIIADASLQGQNDVRKMQSVLDTAAETGVLVIFSYRRQAGGTNHREEAFERMLGTTVNFRDSGDGRTFKVANCQGAEFYNDMFQLRLDEPGALCGAVRAEALRIAGKSVTQVCFDITKGFRVPIGTSAGEVRYLTFGMETDTFHCIIAGQSGKGKTNLLNVIIANGIDKYPSEDLQFILVNCAGPGYQEYSGSPHVMKMCCTSNLETCVEAVSFIGDVQAEREKLFIAVNAVDLEDYVKKTGKRLPRIVCVIDEFQVLYTGKLSVTSHVDDVLVEHILKIGRKYGIHLILSTQSLGGGVRSSLLNNIPTRIALGMTQDQSRAFLADNNKAAESLPRGEAIYNDRNGAREANVPLKIDYLPIPAVEEIVKRNMKVNTH